MADTFVLLDTLPPQFFKVESGKAVPLSGGSLESFASGTTTPQNVYDADGNSLGSTLTLDSRGEIMTVKNIWLKVGDDYKFRLKDADGVEVWTVDDITTDQGIREFSDAITINVPSAKAPFVLNALAQGQLVTGLNADQVDGAHVGENNGDVVLRENLSSAAQQATESAQGVAKVATQAKVDAGTDDEDFVTSLKLEAYSGLTRNTNQDLSDPGYKDLPGGVIMQWGSKVGSGAVSFPKSFPNACFGVYGSVDSDEDKIFLAQSVTVNGFTARVWDTSSQQLVSFTAYWLAFGH